MPLIQIWNKLVNLGTNSTSRDHANKKVRVTNIALIISAFALNLFSLLNWYLGFYELIALDFSLSLIAIFCIYLNVKQYFNFSYIIILGVMPSVFFIYPYFVGNIGAEYYYFFLLIVGFYILDKKRLIFLYSLYIFLLFVGSKYVINNNTFNEKYLVLETVHYYPSIIASIIMVMIATYVFKNETILYSRAIGLKNEELEAFREEINSQNSLLEERNNTLVNLHDDLTSSLNYASKIQKSILLPELQMASYFQALFIINKPKDIVSGDFYWFKELNGVQLISAIDCTGHGVPGAFMTAMVNSLLNEIVDNNNISNPGKILEELSVKLTHTLNRGREDEQVYDGLDIALCALDKENQKLEFAGARRPLYHFSKGELTEYKPTKASIDGTKSNAECFNNNTVELSENDRFYLFSDGYPDQFGGKLAKKEKFMIRKFKQMLIRIQPESIANQRDILTQQLNEWQENEPQTDDILIVAFEV